MATFYGSDTSCVDDLPLIDAQVTDPKVLIGQRIARRLTTPRGALALVSDDGNFGWDVRQYLNGKIAPNTTAVAQQQITDECLKDEQVESATVSIANAAGVMTITIQVVSAAGPFTLTLDVRDLTTALIFGGL
jgi:hypothetical protein